MRCVLPTDQCATRAGVDRADIEQVLRGGGRGVGDEVMAVAPIDRLLHHCHIVNIRGNKYRMRAHRDLLRSTQPDEDGIPGGAA